MCELCMSGGAKDAHERHPRANGRRRVRDQQVARNVGAKSRVATASDGEVIGDGQSCGKSVAEARTRVLRARVAEGSVRSWVMELVRLLCAVGLLRA